MGFVLNVVDEYGNEVPFDRIKLVDDRPLSGCDEITIKIYDGKDTFTGDELQWLRCAVGDKIFEGGTPADIRNYLAILDKIEKIIKRKCDK